MKNYFLIATTSVLISACNQAELDKSKHENDSLLSVINEQKFSITERDSSINDFLSFFNDVERNLDSVAVKQHIISINSNKPGVELKANQKERINTEIEVINALMEQNRKVIAELNHKLKGSVNNNAQLKKMIITLNDQLKQKDIELTALNEKLTVLDIQVAQLQTSVEMLTLENAVKSQNISEKITALHTAYYVIGKTKDLQNAKLIDRKGGLLGIGKTSKLSSNFDNSKFTQIDYTKSNNISINSDNVKIITSHPSDSYTLEKDTQDKDVVKNLIITNPEKFWSASKYLVIVKG